MIERYKSYLSDSSFPILVLSYSLLMVHYVFSRAFRDSLPGSHISVSELPWLTVLGTLLAITLSLICTFFLRSSARIQAIRIFYLVNAVVEVLIALRYQAHTWMFEAYYIEVSASTAIGLSLVWVLIGDWTSNCNAGNTNRVPSVLISGTSAGMFAGFGLVYLPAASDFRSSLLLLAALDLGVFVLLLGHIDGSCRHSGKKQFDEFAKAGSHWSSGVARTLAIVTVLGAATSTLLDLIFRVNVAQHFTTQSARVQFMGSMQSFFCLGALLSQFAVRRLEGSRWAKLCLTLYPATMVVASLGCSFLPVFRVFEYLRIGEYSLRNSVSRCGIEMVYAAMPDKLRIEVRPLVDVVGERVGDMSAAGLLQLFLVGNGIVNARYSLFVLASLGAVLWVVSEWLLRRVNRMQAAAAENAEDNPLPLQKLAREGAVLA